jgi:phage gp29-like protein
VSQLDSTTIHTIRLMQEGGRYYIPVDSGSGKVYRPSAFGERGGRIATPETLYDYFIDYVPPPSEALAQDPYFLSKLHSHPYVTGGMLKRCLTVAAFPWRIEANPRAGDQKLARKISEYCTWVWAQIPHIEQIYYQCVDEGALKGGIGFEWNWHREADGSERPVEFNMVEMTRFVFDRLGNMSLKTRDYPVWGVYVSADLQKQYLKQFPRGKFMYYVHQKRPGTWDNPGLEGYMYYGLGLDAALYIPVTFDTFVLRFRMKWLEKYGLPPTILRYPMNEPVTQETVRIADSLRDESIITMPWLPPGTQAGDERNLYEIEQLEVPTMTNDAFHTFSTDWTKPCINTIILGDPGENATAEESGGGYSERVTRRDSGLLSVARWDALNISATINSQIMPPLALGRWPNLPQDYIPVHRLEPKEEKDRVQEAEIIGKSSEFIEISKDEAYERLGFRRPNAGEETVGKGPEGQGGGAGGPGGGSSGGAGANGGQGHGAQLARSPIMGGSRGRPVETKVGAGGSPPVKPGIGHSGKPEGLLQNREKGFRHGKQRTPPRSEV